MKFEDALKLRRAGRKIRRPGWHPDINLPDTPDVVIYLSDIMAEDWEIVETDEEKLQRERHEWAMEWLERVIARFELLGLRVTTVGWDDVRDVAKDTK